MDDSFLDELFDQAGFTAGSSQPLSTGYTLDVFVEWENCLVAIDHPATPNSPWSIRTDCGSHSQHRWSLCSQNGEIMQLVVKHNTCIKAFTMQPYCRNCQNRIAWRQPCSTPQNVFYILAVASYEECASFLRPISHGRTPLSSEMAAVYQERKPRLIKNIKTPKTTLKRERIDRLRNDIMRDVVRKSESTTKFDPSLEKALLDSAFFGVDNVDDSGVFHVMIPQDGVCDKPEDLSDEPAAKRKQSSKRKQTDDITGEMTCATIPAWRWASPPVTPPSKKATTTPTRPYPFRKHK